MDILSAFRKVTTSVKTWTDNKLESKLDKNLGTDNSGKVLAIGNDGNIQPQTLDDNIVKDSKNPITSSGVYKAVDEVMAVANGKCKTYVFQGESDLNTAIEEYKNNTMSETNPLYGQTLKTGDVFLLKDLNVADYWWDDSSQTIVALEARKFDIPTKLAQLTADENHNTVSQAQIATWNNKSDFSGNYNDLSNKPTIPDWAKQPEKPEYTADEIGGLATVATSGSYNDLKDKIIYEKDKSLHFDTITWNGVVNDTAIEANFGGTPIKFQKVSDTILTLEQLKGSSITIKTDGQSQSDDLIGEAANSLLNCGINHTSVQLGAYLVSVALQNDSIDFNLGENEETVNVIFPNTGTYFSLIPDGERAIFLSSVRYSNIVGLPLNYIPEKIPRLDEYYKLYYNNIPDEAKDYNNLQNRPCYSPDINLSWDGYAKDKVSVEASYNPDSERMTYCKVSDLTFTAADLINGSYTYTMANEEMLFSIQENNIFYGNAGFYISNANFNNLPMIYCVQGQEHFEMTVEGVTMSIDFTDPGVYFAGTGIDELSGYADYHLSSLKSQSKQLDDELIPDTIQRKVNFVELEPGEENAGYIYKLKGIKNQNDEDKFYRDISEKLKSFDAFTIPITFYRNSLQSSSTIYLASEQNAGYQITIDKDISLTPGFTYLLSAVKVNNNEWHGTIIGEQDKDYNNLTNIPVREASADLTWDGNTSGLNTYTTTVGLVNSEFVGQEIQYYLVSDKIIQSSQVLNGTFNLFDGKDEVPFNITQSSIYYNRDRNSGTFYLTDSNIGGTPIIYCVNEQCSETSPLTFDAYQSETGAHTITFTKPGIYFINTTIDSNPVYITKFLAPIQQLDEKFIPESIQRKLDCPPLALGISDDLGRIINAIEAFSSDNIQKCVYNIPDEDGSSFMLPFWATNTIVPSGTDNHITFKIATKMLDNAVDTTGIETAIDVPIGANKSIYSGYYYILVGFKYAGNWSGQLIGKLDTPVDTSPMNGSKNLISSGAVYSSIQNVLEVANGKCKTYVFDNTIADTEENFKAYIEKYKAGTLTNGPLYGVDSNGQVIKLKTGDILLLVQTNLPDYWWDEEAQDVHELEMSKLALAEYVTKAELNNSLSSYITSSGLNTQLSGYATTSSLNSTKQELQNSISNISSIKIGGTSYSLRILNEANDDGGQEGYITFIV